MWDRHFALIVEFQVDESLQREIEQLRAMFWSDRDPEGRVFAPLSDAYRRAGQLEKALELASEGLERLPDFASAHVIAGRVHRDLLDTDTAEAFFRRALVLDEENVHALHDLGGLLQNRGADEEGASLLAKAQELGYPGEIGNSEDAPLLPDQYGTGDTDPGVTVEKSSPEPAVRVPLWDPDDNGEVTPKTRTMAEMLVAQGLTNEAIRVYTELVEAEPDNEELAERLVELSAGSVTPSVEPTAADEGPSIGEYFAQLLAWTPGTSVEAPEVRDDDWVATIDVSASAPNEVGIPAQEVEEEASASGVEVVDITDLAPDEGTGTVVDITLLAPDLPDDIHIVEIGSLAPDAVPGSAPLSEF